MRKILSKFIKLSTFLLIFGLNVHGSHAFAQEPLDWPEARTFGTGEQISVAIARNGIHIVEFHRSVNTKKMWYHVGRLVRQWPSGSAISWGNSHNLDVKGDWPSVAATKDGYVILVNSPANQVVNQIVYWVGKINLSGGSDQEIQWLVKAKEFGYGFHPDVAVNDRGHIALVYECRNGCNDQLNYRLGHLEDPSTNKFNIVWDTGKDAIYYDKGINPHIAINDKGQVLEVHQVGAITRYLHYRRGTLTASDIRFNPSIDKPAERYDNFGDQPAITLTNTGTVVELHTIGDSMYSQTGILNVNDSSRVDWSLSTNIGWMPANVYPAVASNKDEIVATWAACSGWRCKPGTLQSTNTAVK